MQYEAKELQVLHQLSDDPEISKRFAVPPDLKIMAIITMVTLGMAMAAGIFFKVDQIVPAQGVLETQQKLFDVRSTEAGLVAKIHVEEGQFVKAGTPLVEVDPEPIELQISGIESQQQRISRTIWTDFYQIRQFIGRDVADALASKIGTISDPIRAVGYQQILEKTLVDELAVIEQSVGELVARQNRDQKQLESSRQSIIIAEAAMERNRLLLAQELGSQVQFESTQQQFLDAKDRISLLEASIKSQAAEKRRLEAEATKLEGQFVSERLVRIHDNVDEFYRLEYEKSGLKRRLRELSLRAPFDGLVDKLNVLGKSEVIEAGQSIVSLRPEYDTTNLQIDMTVPSNFAIWVQEGMTFRASSLGNSRRITDISQESWNTSQNQLKTRTESEYTGFAAKSKNLITQTV